MTLALLIAGLVSAKLARPDQQPALPIPDQTTSSEPEDNGTEGQPLARGSLFGNEEEEEYAGVLAVEGSGKALPTAEEVQSALNVPEKPAWPPQAKAQAGPEKAHDPAKAVAELAVRHRRDQSEEDLRKQLLWSTEVGLTAEEIPDVIHGFKNQVEACDVVNEERNFGPLALLETSKVARQLPSRRGQRWQLDKKSADEMTILARKLRVYLFQAAPRDDNGHRPSSLTLLRAALEGEQKGDRPEWLRAEAIPVLMQLLMHEDPSLREMLVDLLAEIPGKASTEALACRAVFDLDQSIRDRALVALRDRPIEEIRPVFLSGLRYPWAPAADHAVEGLVALRDVDAAPQLVSLLSEPDPRAPYRGRKNQMYVREVVRVHHLNQCLLCHPPSITYADPSPGVVPGITWNYPVADPTMAALLQASASQTSSTIFGASASSAGCHKYDVLDPKAKPITVPSTPSPRSAPTSGPASTRLQANARRQNARLTTPNQNTGQAVLSTVRLPVLVRGDITYFKQDFSVTQPVTQPGNPLPFNVRFDYLVRVRMLAQKEVQNLSGSNTGQADYPQRQAVLFGLRELTGKDAGDTSEAWQELYPAAHSDDKARELGDKLIAASKKKWAATLEDLKEAKGIIYTDALAYAIAKLEGARKDKAREALAERLTRMTIRTLADKLESDDAEIQAAAIEASVRKESKALVPNLIALLQDEDLAPQARNALQKLTGQKLVDRNDWKDWWFDLGVK